MIAVEIYPIITPIISRITFPLTNREIVIMIIIIAKAPATAAIDIAISPNNPILISAVPPTLPESRIIKATPRLAPELIPSSEGPANGFRNSVCICNPLIDSPAPATKAVIV